MTEVKFYENISDSLLKFAVIIAKSDGKWVFCKYKERDTYEVPGVKKVKIYLKQQSGSFMRKQGQLYII